MGLISVACLWTFSLVAGMGLALPVLDTCDGCQVTMDVSGLLSCGGAGNYTVTPTITNGTCKCLANVCREGASVEGSAPCEGSITLVVTNPAGSGNCYTVNANGGAVSCVSPGKASAPQTSNLPGQHCGQKSGWVCFGYHPSVGCNPCPPATISCATCFRLDCDYCSGVCPN